MLKLKSFVSILLQSKEFVVRCIFCNDPSHKRGDCGLYVDALKERIIIFREKKIRCVATNEHLETNFDRGGMKKLIEKKLGKTNSIHIRGVDPYDIGAGLGNVGPLSETS